VIGAKRGSVEYKLGRLMRLGATLGMTVCTAFTACAGCALATVIAHVAFPPVLLAFDMAFSSTPGDPPFRWLRPMSWLVPWSAVFGACAAGAFLAWQRLHARAIGRLPNKPQEAPSREETNSES
jgi:hypothetical protein